MSSYSLGKKPGVFGEFDQFCTKSGSRKRIFSVLKLKPWFLRPKITVIPLSLGKKPGFLVNWLHCLLKKVHKRAYFHGPVKNLVSQPVIPLPPLVEGYES
ncbi:MAG: hypothetical protein KDI79_23570, partial [Anaerolineae bacterium]|nr:hypothetical protein [Anaerolineae bacterium]